MPVLLADVDILQLFSLQDATLLSRTRERIDHHDFDVMPWGEDPADLRVWIKSEVPPVVKHWVIRRDNICSVKYAR